MHLKYFGTGAAEGIPGLFCTCPVCETARQRRGKDIRTRSQALVDGKLLLDFPPDTYQHVLYGGLDLPSMEFMLLTHSHSDHLYTTELQNRKLGFAYEGKVGVAPSRPLHIYATATAMAFVRTPDYGLEETGVLVLHEIEAFQPFQVDDFTVTALTANHDQSQGAVFYIIARAGKTMLYAHDTGWFPEETWAFLKETAPYFHFVSLDCTEMIKNTSQGHMGLPYNVKVRDALTALGCADENTVFCSHHFSHNGMLNHDELVAAAAELGLLVSYDGMEVTF